MQTEKLVAASRRANLPLSHEVRGKGLGIFSGSFLQSRRKQTAKCRANGSTERRDKVFEKLGFHGESALAELR